MQEEKRRVRRNHALELKQAVLGECRAGASVASVAMAHGLYANQTTKGAARADLKPALLVATQIAPSGCHPPRCQRSGCLVAIARAMA